MDFGRAEMVTRRDLLAQFSHRPRFPVRRPRWREDTPHARWKGDDLVCQSSEMYFSLNIYWRANTDRHVLWTSDILSQDIFMEGNVLE